MVSSGFSDILAVKLNQAGVSVDPSRLKMLIEESVKEFKLNGDLRLTSGPSLWHTLHWIASVADNEKDLDDAYINMLGILANAHPCTVCRSKFLKMVMNNYRPYKPFLKHSIDLHNEVNRQLNKPTYTYDQVYPMYDYGKCEECTFKPDNCKKVGSDWICD